MANREIYKIKIDGNTLRKQIYDRGYTIRSISKEIDLDNSTVGKYLRRNVMPPYMYSRIISIVEDIRIRYVNCLKETAKIELKMLKEIPTNYEIARYRELIVLAYQLEQIMN